VQCVPVPTPLIIKITQYVHNCEVNKLRLSVCGYVALASRLSSPVTRSQLTPRALLLLKTCANNANHTVLDPGCLSRIRIFSIPNPETRIRICIRIKEFKYFNPKNVSRLLEMIRDAHPRSGSGIWILLFYPPLIPDPGVQKALDPGSGFATL
jgi:hypothetical protein